MVKNTTPSITPIILAGGFGTRVQHYFDRPKQFVIREYTSLYQDTIDRVSFSDIPLIISNIEHKAYIESQSTSVDYDVIYEPVSRNTAAAVIIGALSLQKQGKRYAMSLPSDHIINDTKAFQNDVQLAIKHIETHGHSVLFGIEPHHPSSQFGYIQTDTFGNVTNFVEKPTSTRAAELLKSTRCTYWNSGIFIFNIETLIAHVRETCPAFIDTCTQAWIDPTIDHYNAIPNLPFDSLYLEQVLDLFCIEASFDWMDVGTPDIVLKRSAIK